MGDGAEEHEDVPDGVEMSLSVMGEEICAAGVEKAFGYEKGYREP